MSQSISRRSFLKCAGSGAVSLAAALLTGVCAAAQQPCLAGEPALLDGKAAVELLGYAPAPELGGVLVYLSVENLSAASLPVDTSYLQSRGLRTREQLYSMGTGVTAACNGQSVPCGSFAAPLYNENAADASVFTLNLAAGRGALLHCFCAVPEDWQTLELTYAPDFAAGRSVTFALGSDIDAFSASATTTPRDLALQFLARGVRIDTGQGEKDRAKPVQRILGGFQRRHGVLKAGRFGIGGDRLDRVARQLEAGVKGGGEILIPDQIETRQAQRAGPMGQLRIHRKHPFGCARVFHPSRECPEPQTAQSSRRAIFITRFSP